MSFPLPPINLTLSARDVNCCNGALCCIGARNGGNVNINTSPSRRDPKTGTMSPEEGEEGQVDEAAAGNVPDDSILIFDVENSCIRPLVAKELKEYNKRPQKYLERCNQVSSQCYNTMSELGSIQREVLLGLSKLDLSKMYSQNTPLRLRDYRNLKENITQLSALSQSIAVVVDRILALPRGGTEKRPVDVSREKKQQLKKIDDPAADEVSSKLKKIALDDQEDVQPKRSKKTEKVDEAPRPEEQAQIVEEPVEDKTNRLFLKVSAQYDGLNDLDCKLIRKNARVWKRINTLDQAAQERNYVGCSYRHANAIKEFASNIQTAWEEIKGRRRKFNLLAVLEKLDSDTE